MSAMSSNIFRTAAEEAFLEQTPWANPQHPIHQQQQQQPQHHYSQQHRPQGRAFEGPQASSFVTPAGQKRVVDVNAPNGSASTIPENMSTANSSANNTPYGTEQEPRHQTHGSFRNPDYDADRKSGFRSQSSSPLEVRKPQPHTAHAIERRSPAPETSRHSLFSPAVRQNLFQPAVAPKPDTPPKIPPKATDALHYRPPQAELSTGPGPSHMPTR